MVSKVAVLLAIAALINPNEAIDSCFGNVDFYPCYCNNVSVEGHSISSVICERPQHDTNGLIVIPKMKYLVIDQLIIADAYWDGKRSNGGRICDPYGRCQVVNSLIMPELSHFRIRELVVKNGDISKKFLSNETYFQEQKNFLRALTLSHSSLFGSLQGVIPNQRQNNAINDALHTTAFKPLAKLELLDLSSNNITGIFATAFQLPLPSLRELRLNRNFISFIETNCFGNLTSLEVLDLSFNKLKEINSNIFAKNSSIGSLTLGYNEIESLSSDLLHKLKHLFYLDLQFNFLFQIPNDLFKSPLGQLETLNLEGNFLLCGCGMKPEPSYRRKTPLRVEGMCQEPKEFAGLRIADISNHDCEHLATNKDTFQNTTSSSKPLA